jgi:hypothetical protein
MNCTGNDWEELFHQQFKNQFKTPPPSNTRQNILKPGWNSFVARDTSTIQITTWLQHLQSIQWLLHNGRGNITENPLEAIDDFTPCLCITGKTGVNKSSYIRALLHEQQYKVLEAHDLFPQDQKEMFLKRLAQALMQERTIVIIDDTETISNSQLLPVVAFLRKCRKIMSNQLIHVQEHMSTHKTATDWNVSSGKRHLLKWTDRTEQMKESANILDGLSMISGVIFICHDLDYLQPRLQPLHALCQHIYLTPLTDTQLVDAFTLSQTTSPPLSFDINLLAQRCHGNWHKFYTMLDWCILHKVQDRKHVESELDKIARYDDLHSKDHVLKQLFKFNNHITSPPAMTLAEMEIEHDLDIIVFENQWSLMFRNDSPETYITTDKHVLWSNELSLMDCFQTRMTLHDTDREDIAVEFADCATTASSSGGVHIDGASTNTTESITTVFDEQQMEYIASWLQSMVLYQSNHLDFNNTCNTTSKIKVGKTKRKHERAMENYAKRGEQVCYAPSLWDDHITKQVLVTGYRLRLMHGQQLLAGLSMAGHATQCELLRYVIEYQYLQFCERQKQRRVSAYTKKIVPFDELPLELQFLMRQSGIIPNQGRVEGTYYFWFKFPGFIPDTSILPVEEPSPVIIIPPTSNKKFKRQRK